MVTSLYLLVVFGIPLKAEAGRESFASFSFQYVPTVPIIGISSGLRDGDFLGEEVADRCFSSSTVNAPKIGLSSKLLGDLQTFPEVTVPELQGLALVTLDAGELNQLERLASTATSWLGFLYRSDLG